MRKLRASEMNPWKIMIAKSKFCPPMRDVQINL